MEQLARATSPDHLDEIYDLICWVGLHVIVDAITFDALRRLVTVDLTTKRAAEDGAYLARFVIGDARKVAIDADEDWTGYEELSYDAESRQWRLEGIPPLELVIDALTVDLTVLGHRD